MKWEVKKPIEGYNTDVLGYRAKVGAVVPGTNTTVQPEYESMRPAGVTNHIARMYLPPRPYDDLAAYKRALETEEGKLEEALELLLKCEPAAVAHGHSIHSFRADVARGLEEQKKLSEFCKVPFWTPSVAILKGLEALGNPKRIAVLSPYYPPADDMIANWFRSGGFDVVKSNGLKASGPTNVSRIPLERIYEGFRSIDDPKAEVLIQVGTALPITGITEELERRHGKPVVGVNVATYWATMRSIGIEDRKTGFGKLYAEH